MPSIKGTVKNGLVYPNEAIADQEGKSVIITIIEPNPNIPSTDELSWDESSWNSEDWDQFDQLIEKCTIDTGIVDLAHQHDHYIHGTPKRESYP
jgi:hypothetical protein